MQVLLKTKVKFVSAVVCLLTSFWICLWFSLSSGSYCLTLEKEKKKGKERKRKCAQLVLQIFQGPTGR